MSNLSDFLATFQKEEDSCGRTATIEESAERLAESQRLSYRDKLAMTYGRRKFPQYRQFISIAEEEEFVRRATTTPGKIRVVCGAWCKEFDLGLTIDAYRQEFGKYTDTTNTFAETADRISLPDDYIPQAGEDFEFFKLL